MLDQKQEGVNDIIFAEVSVMKDGKALGMFRPEKIFYGNWDEPSSEVAIVSSWTEDLYLVLSAWEEDGRATFIVKVNPMMSWLWLGSIVVVIGTLFAVWNGRFGNVTPKYSGPQRRVV
jgi:cytochrome c-type biogenesis protein CcmF